ncbi:MAG: twin-arginine translocation signal domain-containing protein [Prevotellaceae bacterium]|jgi:hypothetical protein|nr:twin-arginine translocation signal domain-containing protein [Prevotellaceae bacterium]
MDANNNKNISRRQFLQTCGTVVAGIGAASGLGYLFHRTLVAPANGDAARTATMVRSASGTPVNSPYKLVAAVQTDAPIDAFDRIGGLSVVASDSALCFYNRAGKQTRVVPLDASPVRDLLTVNDERIYVLFPTSIAVYGSNGEQQLRWEACSERSDYCSIAVSPKAVYVTDASNKNICQYTPDGRFVRFIDSPDGFIVPSYSFGIACAADGSFYCSNPGRHRVEHYTADGTFIASFGQSGNDAGHFCGCCNPVYMAVTPEGDLLTSEKGIPRICCYDGQGAYRALLLDTRMMGGGHAAYRVKTNGAYLYVAGGTRISTFHYDPQTAAATACGTCSRNECPLRAGITI